MTNQGGDMPESWDELARSEYAKGDEPISARASDLTKLGAPVAAFIASILAAVGGWVSTASPDVTVIAVAIVVAFSVSGLFYVFAADFRARALVAVARFENLAILAGRQAEATAAAQAEAKRAVDVAEAAATERLARAEDAEKRGKELLAQATAAQASADEKSGAASALVTAAEARTDDLQSEIDHAHAALRRCRDREEGPPPSAAPPAPPAAASYLTLGGLSATVGGEQVTIHAVESSGSTIVRLLVRGTDGQLRWVAAADLGVT